MFIHAKDIVCNVKISMQIRRCYL